jgi:hypothetical protein
VQGAFSPLPDWKGNVLADPSGQAGLEKVPSSLGVTYPIDQPEDQQSVIFEAPSDGTDGTEGEQLSTDYHW